MTPSRPVSGLVDRPSRGKSGAAGRRLGSARWVHGLALVLCGATVLLLAAGALVVGTGSSLAVPDWPLAYGQLFPPMVGGILFEHGHRMVAATVGLLTLSLAISLAVTEPRRWVRWLGFGAVLAVMLQGALGGITVLLLLPKSVSISHALLAQGFFVLTVLLAQVTAPGGPALVAASASVPIGSRRKSNGAVTRWLGVALIAALEGELLLGALVRHNAAGLAIPDFPLSLGRLVPPLDTWPVTLHYLHRVGAAAVLTLVIATAWAALRQFGGDVPLRRRVAALVLFLAIQVSLGASIIWTERGIAVTTLHVVNGALLMGAAVLTTMRAWMLGRVVAD